MNAAARVWECGVCAGLYLRFLPSCPRCLMHNALRESDKTPADVPKPSNVIAIREGIRLPGGRAEAPSARDDGDDGDEAEVVMLSDVESEDFERFESGIWTLDKVLDGGLAYGATILLSGDKGAGKTTLSTRIVMEHALSGERVFLASAEEPVGRFRYRAERLGYNDRNGRKAISTIATSRETDILRLLDVAEKHKPSMILFDSLRKFTHPDVQTISFLTHGPRVIDEIVQFTEAFESCSLVISRLTKAGKLAGAEDTGYDVDTILKLQRHAPKGVKTKFVKLGCEKNRLGREECVGWFKKTERGLLCSNGPKKRSGHSKNSSE